MGLFDFLKKKTLSQSSGAQQTPSLSTPFPDKEEAKRHTMDFF